MTHTAFRPGFVSVIAAAAVLFLALPGAAAQRPATPSSGRVPAVEQDRTGSAPIGILDNADAERTREEFNNLLEKYPPALGRVLKLDPSLMSNPGYLAPYPGLAAFLNQHPEIVRNPEYFLERINSPNYNYNDPGHRKREDMLAVLAGFAAFCTFLVVTSVFDLGHPDDRGAPAVEPAVEGAVRSAQQAARPVHVQRRPAGLRADARGQALPRVGADSDAGRGPDDVGAVFADSLVGPGRGGADDRRVRAPLRQLAVHRRAGAVLHGRSACSAWLWELDSSFPRWRPTRSRESSGCWIRP